MFLVGNKIDSPSRVVTSREFGICAWNDIYGDLSQVKRRPDDDDDADSHHRHGERKEVRRKKSDGNRERKKSTELAMNW